MFLFLLSWTNYSYPLLTLTLFFWFQVKVINNITSSEALKAGIITFEEVLNQKVSWGSGLGPDQITNLLTKAWINLVADLLQWFFIIQQRLTLESVRGKYLKKSSVEIKTSSGATFWAEVSPGNFKDSKAHKKPHGCRKYPPFRACITERCCCFWSGNSLKKRWKPHMVLLVTCRIRNSDSTFIYGAFSSFMHQSSIPARNFPPKVLFEHASQRQLFYVVSISFKSDSYPSIGMDCYCMWIQDLPPPLLHRYHCNEGLEPQVLVG